MLEVENLVAGYKRDTVLHGISVSVDQGQIVAIVGPNGAGKSTLLRSIAGLLPHRSGTIRFEGRVLRREPTNLRARRRLVLCPEGRQLFPSLSVEENIRLGGLAARGRISAADVDAVYDYFPALASRRKQATGTMSGGEQQMVALARALVAQPKVLLLDEPTLGLAVGVIDDLSRVLRAVCAREGTGILLVEQDPVLPMLIADVVFPCVEGRLSGPLEAAEKNERLLASFFEQALEARAADRSRPTDEPQNMERK